MAMPSLPFTRNDLLGVLAGVAIILVGLIMLSAGADPCGRLTEFTSHVGGISVPPDGSPPSSPDLNNPYALGVCDYWPSTTEQLLTLAGVLAVFAFGILAVVRIGDSRPMWRVSAAVVVAILAFVFFVEIFHGP